MQKSLVILSLSLTGSIAYAADESSTIDYDNYTPKHVYSLRPSNESTSLSWAMENSSADLLTIDEIAKLPSKYDFSSAITAIHDQGRLGSCTAQAITLSMEYKLQEMAAYQRLSPLFLYYNERKLMGTINEDSGASLSDGIKAICTWGVCRESLWTYSDDKKKFRVKPTNEAYEDAKNYMGLDSIKTSYVTYSLDSIKARLAKNIPVVFGVYVYPSFESGNAEKTGKIPMPGLNERPIGGHALMFTGYDDEAKEFKFANSWGTRWGDKGFGYLKYDYVMNVGATPNRPLFFANDIWSIDRIGQESALTELQESSQDVSVRQAA
ncbi:C1 family peptidase [Candidatus Odyssella thessalonicensis]|uniref:C1 family peptidase n=1 Tax=Candidatus Odyssella thessalonicensis TaxID=84647 RepID=UPI000225AE93|nr:C1 family peptidase [Candidatus Odyssella thessalonicensis]